MDFLQINQNELTALMDLPWGQRVVYLMAIRPFMDNESCIVGIKRKISYQSLREALYVAPIAGVKTEAISQQQVRRMVKSLERAGLIKLQSSDMRLILKCILASRDRSVQNKADRRATPKADTIPRGKRNIKSESYQNIHGQADTGKMIQADTPLKDNNICFVLLREKFEIFWSTYPLPQNRPKTWDVFQRLNPDGVLFEEMMVGLLTQITHDKENKVMGRWVPHWKYPANWLLQQSWKDELITYENMENTDANHKQHSRKKSDVDIIWESCKGGAYFNLESDSDEAVSKNNIIEFTRNVRD